MYREKRYFISLLVTKFMTLVKTEKVTNKVNFIFKDKSLQLTEEKGRIGHLRTKTTDPKDKNERWQNISRNSIVMISLKNLS